MKTQTPKTTFFDCGDIAVMGWTIGDDQVYITASTFAAVMEDEPELVAHTTAYPDTPVYIVRRDNVKRGFPIPETSIATFSLGEAGLVANELCEEIRHNSH